MKRLRRDSHICSLAFSPNGLRVAVGGSSMVYILATETCAELQTVQFNDDICFHGCFYLPGYDSQFRGQGGMFTVLDETVGSCERVIQPVDHPRTDPPAGILPLEAAHPWCSTSNNAPVADFCTLHAGTRRGASNIPAG